MNCTVAWRVFSVVTCESPSTRQAAPPCSTMLDTAASAVRTRPVMIELPSANRSTMVCPCEGSAYACTSIRPIPPVSTLPSSTLAVRRSEEHTSELQSLMRTSYAVFCLQKKKRTEYYNMHNTYTPPIHITP